MLPVIGEDLGMRFALTVGLTAASFMAVACVAGLTAQSAGVGASASATLDPSRAADRQMIAFGEANPQCQLWTNWERLCSRTGLGGGIQCHIDPGRRVASSLPFCAVGRQSGPRDARGNWFKVAILRAATATAHAPIRA